MYDRSRARRGRAASASGFSCQAASTSALAALCAPTTALPNGHEDRYLVAKDEGHGFAKKGNVDYQRAVLFEFVRRYLLAEPAEAPAK